MAKKRKVVKAETKLPVDPDAPVFQPGDRVVVLRRVLWSGYSGVVDKVDGGLCRCRLNPREAVDYRFSADIPAKELKKV